MLKIKLVRFGKKGQPHYRIVIQEARTKRDGAYTALLGHYAPTQTPKILNLDLQAYREWIAKGAQPTETVASLAKRLESGKPFPPKKQKPSKKQLAKAQAAAAAKEEPVPVEPVETETPVAEAEAPAAAETPAPTETAEATETTEATPETKTTA